MFARTVIFVDGIYRVETLPYTLPRWQAMGTISHITVSPNGASPRRGGWEVFLQSDDLESIHSVPGTQSRLSCLVQYLTLSVLR